MPRCAVSDHGRKSGALKRLTILTACCLLLTAPSRPAPTRAGPELYGLGLFTTGAWDFFMAFSPDQRTVVQDLRNAVEWARVVAAGAPAFAAGGWSDAAPHFTSDGRRVFFISNRPVGGGSVPSRWYDIWYVDRMPTGEWSDPVHLPAPVNGDTVDKWSPSVARNGNLYFGSSRPGGRGGSDIWVSRWVNGAYQPPAERRVASRASGPFTGRRFDVPRIGRNIDGVGSGSGDIYRLPMRDLRLGP
jgi:hypothetical protein